MAKIGIDISALIYGTGVSGYTKNLVESLISIDKQDDFLLFGGSLRRSHELRKFVNKFSSKNVTSKIVLIPPTLLSYLWNDLHKFPLEKMTGNLDVFHSSDWTQPPTQAYKVTTIHDLAPLRFPESTPEKIVSTHRKRFEWVKKEVDKIIAVSQFTKKEAIELLQIDPNKIVVIPEAPNISSKKSRNNTQEILAKFNLPEKFLLVVGTDSRKNLPQIISAFKKIKKDQEMSLVIVGRAQRRVEDGVHWLGYVTNDELAGLYSQAVALVYASTYEGFGLPILDAMQAECPVVTSNLSSMPEVAGDAAVLVNPYEVEEIERGIFEVIKNRAGWVNKGRRRVKKYSWVDTAQETLKVYREANK